VVWADGRLEELARIADGLATREFRLRAKLARGRTALWSGHFAAAARVFGQFVDDVAREPIQMRAETYGVAPVVAAYAEGCLALWFLGYPDRARQWAGQAIARAEESRETYSHASALVHASFLALLCGDADGTARLAERAEQVSGSQAVARYGKIGHLPRRRGPRREGRRRGRSGGHASRSDRASRDHRIAAERCSPRDTKDLREAQALLDERAHATPDAAVDSHQRPRPAAPSRRSP
jgi:hypothetical protein